MTYISTHTHNAILTRDIVVSELVPRTLDDMRDGTWRTVSGMSPSSGAPLAGHRPLSAASAQVGCHRHGGAALAAVSAAVRYHR